MLLSEIDAVPTFVAMFLSVLLPKTLPLVCLPGKNPSLRHSYMPRLHGTKRVD